MFNVAQQPIIAGHYYWPHMMTERCKQLEATKRVEDIQTKGRLFNENVIAKSPDPPNHCTLNSYKCLACTIQMVGF
jgi:hypothetical protein